VILFGYQVNGLRSEPLANSRRALVNSISDVGLLNRAPAAIVKVFFWQRQA
jgi:hypothetical protein